VTTTVAASAPVDLETRARRSLGASADPIYDMVAAACAARAVAGGCVVDVGCGGGGLWRVLRSSFTRYCGIDAVRYDAFPNEGEFAQVDLDADAWPDLRGQGDVVTALETIEHLENPWAFMRRLAALARPGGLVIVTTPNQLSLLSVLTLVAKRRFSSFQDAHFPVHKTALLESDLCRAASEAGLIVEEIGYSLHGRVPLTGWHYPRPMSRLAPRLLSDNVMVVCRKLGSDPTPQRAIGV
jgi:2-polyprenyl-3-methyl-5-hydroxy-6-metoxy-1,4-benzoquinol methylase